LPFFLRNLPKVIAKAARLPSLPPAFSAFFSLALGIFLDPEFLCHYFTIFLHLHGDFLHFLHIMIISFGNL